VIAALLDVGILLPGQPLHLSKQALIKTSGYRRGVRDTLKVLPKQEQSAQLCATLPIGLASLVENALREEVLDLRATLFDLIASARTRVIVASPFWDNATANEISELFNKRLSSKVLIDVLGRIDKGSGNEYVTLARRFTSFPSIHFYNWYEPNSEDLFGTRTFHFKAVVVDNGDKAYLGSANMTSGGLRSRMELGVVLRGNTAVTLAHILEIVLRISTRM
jgi:phosphatidylserine/phosphatidylglycerophosphate/cardiolipin synthase-like enzyme